MKVYTDLKLIEGADTPVVEMFMPFLGQNDFERQGLSAGRFDIYERTGKEFVELTSAKDCDVCVLPICYPQYQNIGPFLHRVKPLTDEAAKYGKKVMLFIGSDIDAFDVQIPDAIIFHNTLYQSRRKKNEFSFTFYFEDFIKKFTNGKLVLREKESVPVIGFCGFAPPLGQPLGVLKIRTTLRLYLNQLGLMKYFPGLSAHSYRVRALKSVLKSKKVNKNIIVRSNFGFGGPFGQLFPGGGVEDNNLNRKNYVQNMIDSDYVLCVRGYGNNSMRFFEALCCGRIPVFVNTDCVLPYDFKIDWKKYCVWVEEKDIDRIAEKVLEFHSKLSDEEFKNLQIKAREIWKEYCSAEGFFKNIYMHLNPEEYVKE